MDTRTFYEQGRHFIDTTDWSTKNPDIHLQMYKIAAQQGHADAQALLGYCYANGIGYTLDRKLAIQYYMQAIEQQHHIAEYELGCVYRDAPSNEKDYDKAVLWFTKAAHAGNMDAQFALGQCYADGMGVEANQEEAELWFGRAASRQASIERSKSNSSSTRKKHEYISSSFSDCRFFFSFF